MSDGYKYYMSRYIKSSKSWEKEVSLEDYFKGLKYVSCDGLSAKGKVKNIYTENYAETEELRCYIPDEIARENTDIELVLAFSGTNRRDVYDQFMTWVSGYKVKFWDTCRNREVEMVLIESPEIEDDYLYGSDPYMTVTFKFKNIKGQTTKKS